MKLRAVIIFLALALALWIGVRVQNTLATRAEIEKTRVAKSSDAPGIEGQEVSTRIVVRGKSEPWVPEVKLEGTLVPLRETDLAFKAGEFKSKPFQPHALFAGFIGAALAHGGKRAWSGK